MYLCICGACTKCQGSSNVQRVEPYRSSVKFVRIMGLEETQFYYKLFHLLVFV